MPKSNVSLSLLPSTEYSPEYPSHAVVPSEKNSMSFGYSIPVVLTSVAAQRPTSLLELSHPANTKLVTTTNADNSNAIVAFFIGSSS